MATLYVLQDGADFYIHEDPEYERLLRVETAPFRVADFDMEAALRARAWFKENVYFKGVDRVEWFSFGN